MFTNKQRCVFLLGKFSRFFDLINHLSQSSFKFTILHFVHHLQNRVLPFPEELEIPVSSAPVLRGFPFFCACLHLVNTIMKTYLRISMSIQVIFPFRTSESTEGSFVTLYSGLLTEPDWFDNLRIVEPRINISQTLTAQKELLRRLTDHLNFQFSSTLAVLMCMALHNTSGPINTGKSSSDLEHLSK